MFRIRCFHAGSAIGLGVAVVVGLLATACQPGAAGPLEPLGGQGGAPVVRGSGPSVTVDAGSVRVAVSGQWTSHREQTLYLRYTNTGATPVRIDAAAIGLRRGDDALDALTIFDRTGVDPADRRSDNDVPAMLGGIDAPGPAVSLVIAPGASRMVEASFANTPGPGDAVGIAPVDAGQTLTANVPMGKGSVTSSFRTAEGSWF